MKKLMIFGLSALTGVTIGTGIIAKIYIDKARKIQSDLDKYQTLFLMTNQWIKAKQNGKDFSAYFEKNGYHKIAIYGMGYLGETLLDELKGSNISVVYGIDRRAGAFYTNIDIDVVSISDDLRPVDAVVVTAITYFSEIEEALSDKVDCPILSLEDILYEV